MPGNTAKYPGAAAAIADLTVATNQGATTLSSTINGVVTTIPVASVVTFTAPCLVWIDNECIFVGTANSGSFTGCVRGFDNTSATSHASGVAVQNLVTAYHHNQPAAEVIAIEADLIQGMTGDVLKTAGTSTTTLVNIPADTPASKLLVTNVVAPSTPATGKTEVYVDSTQKVLSAKNDAGTVSITVVSSTASSGSFVTGVGPNGVLLTGTVGSGGLPQFTGGDVTSPSAGSIVLSLVNIPTATPMAGDLLATQIAAPSTPASGKTALYADSTDKNFKAKDDSGNITVTVSPVTATSGKFLTALGTAGGFTLASAINPVTATAGTFVTGVNAAGTFTVGTAINPVTATAGTFVTGVNASGTFSVGTAINPVTATSGTFITGVNASGTFTVGTAITAVSATAGTFLSAVTAAGVFSAAQAYYQTLDTAGGALTQRPSLNFIAGTGITVLASDNSGASRTDLTFSQSTTTNAQYIDYKGAISQAGVAALGFSVGTANAPTAVVVAGANTVLGAAAFSANSVVQDHFVLPSDWVGAIDADIYWTSPDTSGTAVWSIALGKALPGTNTVDQAFNSASLGTSTVNGSANVLNRTTITGITATGLAADAECFFKLLLSSTSMSGGVANLTSLRITIRRAY